MTDVQGVYPVVATPFDESGAVDYEGVRSIVRTQIERGCQGVILFGIAAEFYKLASTEERKIVRVAADECSGTETALLVSVTQHATELAVERAEFAERAGADALMLLPPFFLGPSESDIYEHVERVAGAVSLPIMVQYAPEQTGVPINPATFRDLSEATGNVEYYKIESQPPGPYISELLEVTDGSVDALVGYAGIQMIEAMDRGAVGVIPGSSISDVYLKIYEHHRRGDRSEAVTIHDDLLPLLMHTVQDIEMFIHYEKRMLHERGMIDADIAYCRSPSFTPDEYQNALFEDYYAAIEQYL